MADFYQGGASRFVTYGADSAASRGTEVVSGGSTNTKGSYAQLTASTEFASDGVLITIGRKTNNNTCLLDIAIGAAASEIVIISNLFVRAHVSSEWNITYFFPIRIPAGVRLSARWQTNSGTSQTTYVTATLIAGGYGNSPVLSGVESYGTNTGSTEGTLINCTHTVNTKSAWQILAASTGRDVQALVICSSPFAASATDATLLMDIGIGGAGAEIVLIPDIAETVQAAVSGKGHSIGPIPCAIPAGSRLTYRTASATSSANIYSDVVLYGIY